MQMIKRLWIIQSRTEVELGLDELATRSRLTIEE